MRVSQPLRALCFSLSRYRLNRLTLLAISNYSNKTATPSPVMFWTVKAPFWYTLVVPRPEETAHPLRSRQPPRRCAGQARRDAPHTKRVPRAPGTPETSAARWLRRSPQPPAHWAALSGASVIDPNPHRGGEGLIYIGEIEQADWR